jgi:signal transduction histidine kinase
MDYTMGWEYNLSVVYALPIIGVTWKSNQCVGFVFALLCTVIGWSVHLGNNPYQSQTGFTLAILSQLFYFVVLVFAISVVKNHHALDRARLKRIARTQQLEQDILEASEREQHRIGCDLHDELGSHLAAIGYALALLANSKRGIGLCSMRYRARALGGDLNIKFDLNQGTTVSCVILNQLSL